MPKRGNFKNISNTSDSFESFEICKNRDDGSKKMIIENDGSCKNRDYHLFFLLLKNRDNRGQGKKRIMGASRK